MSIKERVTEIRHRQVSHIRGWVRENLKRPITVTLMVMVAVLKPLKFLHPILPTKVRAFIKCWDWQMIKVFLFSLGKRAYMDQPCSMKDPPTWKPLVEVDPKWRFSEDDIKKFYEQGFLGPFTLCSREEMIGLRETVAAELMKRSAVYGVDSGPGKGRDRHLDCPTLWRLLQRPEWTERLAQLLGPNLLLWRSQVFLKPPGAPEITWHQASTYLSEEGYKATLYPRDRNELFQLTTWVAFDDVDLDNGCMQFLKGTHRRIHTMKLGGEDAEGFAKARVRLEVDITPENTVTMEMKAGQFIIFSERCIHGSPPNSSKDRRRWGMAFRTIKPSVKVYDDDLRHRVFYLEENFSLENWGAVVLRGQDTEGLNKIIDPFADVRGQQIAANEAAAQAATPVGAAGTGANGHAAEQQETAPTAGS
jgi:non-heme Fe2+,alpha-ketoglutarate-dependent halogenase